MRRTVIAAFLVWCLFGVAQGQYSESFVFGDARPDAPELAYRGDHGVGVRTLEVTNPDQLDILRWTEEETDPRYDRPLTLEVWYPALIPEGEEEMTEYQDFLGAGPDNPERPNTPFSFRGRALRDAEPDTSGGPYPLVIVSHGYPGSRYLMAYLADNLASKGYLVVAIDHTESTRTDRAAFSSTLLNRPLDILFVLDAVAEMAESSDGFWAGLADADNTGLIGYSMGGYGVINAAGAGISQTGVDQPWGVPGGHLAVRQTGNPDFIASQDARIKAVVLLAPWGGDLFYDAEGMAQ
nr:dienelactone hydrolase [Deinococcota bacterium]